MATHFLEFFKAPFARDNFKPVERPGYQIFSMPAHGSDGRIFTWTKQRLGYQVTMNYTLADAKRFMDSWHQKHSYHPGRRCCHTAQEDLRRYLGAEIPNPRLITRITTRIGQLLPECLARERQLHSHNRFESLGDSETPSERLNDKRTSTARPCKKRNKFKFSNSLYGSLYARLSLSVRLVSR